MSTHCCILFVILLTLDHVHMALQLEKNTSEGKVTTKILFTSTNRLQSKINSVPKKDASTTTTVTISTSTSTPVTPEPCKLAKIRRPLQKGDTFTPQEMFPLAKKLMLKVKHPGKGSGIVSSAKLPEALSDNIFEAFFNTEKRIIIIKADDIPDLNELQEVAIGNEKSKYDSCLPTPEEDNYDKNQTRSKYLCVIRTASSYVNYTSVGKDTLIIRYQTSQVIAKKRFSNQMTDDEPIETSKKKYARTLQHKKTKRKRVNPKSVRKNEMGHELGNDQRRGIPQAKLLSKKRHLILNPKQRRMKVPGRKKIVQKSGKTNKKGCSWKYVCKDEDDIDTCRLHYTCNKKVLRSIQNLPQKWKNYEDVDIDKEIERILKNRAEKFKIGGVKNEKGIVEYFKNAANDI